MPQEHSHESAAHAPAPASASTPDQLLRLPQTLERVGLGRTAWLDRVKAGTAPKPVKIGRATCWAASDVQAWIADRLRESRGQAPN
jgi:prophage regulatory protein